LIDCDAALGQLECSVYHLDGKNESCDDIKWYRFRIRKYILASEMVVPVTRSISILRTLSLIDQNYLHHVFRM
jgi:hypothetical protein